MGPRFGARDIKAALGRIETQLTTFTTSTFTALNSAIDQGFERLATAISGTQARVGGVENSINARIDAVNTRIDAVQANIGALRHSTQTAADGQQIRHDIAELHALIAGWKAEAAEARRLYEAAHQQKPPQSPSADPEPGTDGEPSGGDRRSHSQLLRTAASISAATLTCHRDLWAFFVERSADRRHFRVPGLVREVDEGKVCVTLSGRTIIASLTALDQVQREHGPDRDEDWALAGELYEAIANVVEAAGQGPRSGAGGEVAIVIDRRPGAGAASPPTSVGAREAEVDDTNSGDEPTDDGRDTPGLGPAAG